VQKKLQKNNNLSLSDQKTEIAQENQNINPELTEQQKEAVANIEKENNTPLHKNDFGYAGTLEIEGYSEIQKKPCEPVGMCQGELEYVSLVVTKSNSQIANQYFKENKTAGLGCYQKEQNQIISVSYGDGGTVENKLEGEILDKIMKSSKSSKVKLILTKPLLSWGSSTLPACYSDFRNIKIQN
jgi:hypothetical protein